MEIKIDGLDKIVAKLRHLGGDVDDALDKGVHIGALKVQADAKTYCPVDTEQLRGSISCERIAKGAYAVGTNVEYAVYVEYGTGLRGNPDVPHTSAVVGTYPHPYLMPALASNHKYVYKACQAQLIKAIRERMI